MEAKSVSVLFCLLVAGSVCVGGEFTPVAYPARVTSECDQHDILQDEQLTEDLSQVQQQLGPPGFNFPMNKSCQMIFHCFPLAPSGYYQITAPNGSLVEVYCDMEGTNCEGQGGWMRVAYVNMSQPGASCPQGLTQRTYSGLTLCGRKDGDFIVVTPLWWRMSEHSVLHTRIELFSSVWTTTRLPVYFTSSILSNIYPNSCSNY